MGLPPASDREPVFELAAEAMSHHPVLVPLSKAPLVILEGRDRLRVRLPYNVVVPSPIAEAIQTDLKLLESEFMDGSTVAAVHAIVRGWLQEAVDRQLLYWRRAERDCEVLMSNKATQREHSLMADITELFLALNKYGRGPGWHFCVEWDFLLVGPPTPEWGDDPRRCLCGQEKEPVNG